MKYPVSKLINKVSFVLLVTLKEEQGRVADTQRWRNSPNEGSILRTSFLLRSFIKYFRQTDLCEFLIVCPSRDVSAIDALLKSLTADPRFKLLPEGDLVSESKVGQLNGWVNQQLLKLAVAHRIRSSHYVTLDSDILCVKPFGYTDLLSDGKAIANTETVEDYRRIYTEIFCLKEESIKTARYQKAAELLGYKRPKSLSSMFFGETPCVLHARSVIKLTEYLEERFKKSWIQTLGDSHGWTEYSLYFQFMEMTGQLRATYVLGGCDEVLDLERSVWQDSRHYRYPRSYDAKHFLTNPPGKERGLFVAIQSWLPISSWLPPRCHTLGEFYKEVELWLLA